MVRIISPELCARCKGRLWCGLKKCPILESRKILKTVRVDSSLEAYTPPSLLVGWSGYPRVSVSPLITLTDPRVSDNPPLWAEKYGIEDILDIRLHMGGASRRLDVKESDSFLLSLQELAMSRREVPTDVEFQRPPRTTVSFSSLFPPMGFRGELKSIELAENPRVDRRVEKLYYDEVKAQDAVIYLYEKNYDVYPITRYLTAGLLGEKKKLVPTRWAITAVDNIISSHILSQIRDYPSVERILLFHSHLYDNHFFIFFIPGPWSFEVVEAWAPQSFWARGKLVMLSDGEYGRERRDYAKNVGGSYYASKVAVLEKLRNMKRMASVLILREIHEGYYAPLGVWQVRENVRNALRSKPLEFSSLQEALNYSRTLGMRIPPEKWREHSTLLKGVQRRLF